MIDRGFATNSTELLTQYVLIFFALVIALAVGTFTRYYWVTWLGERVIADIRRKVFDHLIDLHPGFFEQNRSLEIQSRLTADMTLLQSVIGSSVSFALRNLIMMIGGIIWLFITNAKLTAIVMICVPLVVAPILIFGRRVRTLSRQSQDKVAAVGAYVGEILGQIKTVQSYNHQEIDKKQFHQHVEEAFAVAKRRITQRALLVTMVIILVLGAVGMMLWVGGMDVIEGKISGGELAAFVFYSVIVGSAVASISEVIGELQRAAGAAERTVELLDTPNEIQSPQHSLALPTISGNIKIEQLSFSYSTRPDIPVIHELSLTIKAGETLALVGPSGAGKSTLFDLLLRFFDVQSGCIKLEGVDIRHLDIHDLRRCFALVSQNPALFYGSIIDNLLAAPDVLGLSFAVDADQSLVISYGDGDTITLLYGDDLEGAYPELFTPAPVMTVVTGTSGQDRINTFADCTEDHQFIHIDEEAAAKTPFGGTIAHGMLTLSMMSGMAYGALPVMAGAKASINYGFDSVRFIALVHSGKRIRGRFTLAEAQTRGRGDLMTRFAATVEIEGAERPALKADWLVLYQF